MQITVFIVHIVLFSNTVFCVRKKIVFNVLVSLPSAVVVVGRITTSPTTVVDKTRSGLIADSTTVPDPISIPGGPGENGSNRAERDRRTVAAVRRDARTLEATDAGRLPSPL